MASRRDENEVIRLEDTGHRCVLIVTTPVGASFQAIARAVGHNPPANSPVDWSSFDTTALPDIDSRLTFTTHYALCVIEASVWQSSSLSLLDKFRTAGFWDHPGNRTIFASAPSSRSPSSRVPTCLNAGEKWSSARILQIDSGEVIGWTNLPDHEITQDYSELRRDWMYQPIFWNCHDLAIRLCHIIMQPSTGATQRLKALSDALGRAYWREVGYEAKSVKATAGGIGALALAAAVPPLAVPLWTLGVCAGFGGSVGGLVGSVTHRHKLKAKEKAMGELEALFPVLEALHR